MKYELDTLPVWEAYEAGGECPLCYLARKLEKQNLTFFLGGSVMQPVVRKQVNQYGFCTDHFLKLLQNGEKLTVGILAQSRFLALKGELEREEQKVRKAAGKKAFHQAVAAYNTGLRSRLGQCALCLKSHRALKRYAYTIVYLWKKKEDFRSSYTASRGFCYTHLPLVLDMAGEILSAGKREEFVTELLALQAQQTLRLEEEIDWFIRKYDYRNKDLPWKTSKDALVRLLQRLLGIIPG